MKMKQIVSILAVLALVPAMAAADDLSANFTSGGQGFASLQTSGSSITYGIVVSGIGNPSGAQIMQGNNVFVDLGASFSGGSAFGAASTTSGNVTALNNDTGAYTLRVTGSGGTATGQIVNNGAGTGGGAGSVEFTNGTFAVFETAGSAEITVQRVGGTAGAASVDYATSDGTGVAGVDYTETTGTLNWADGEADVKTINVPILDNGVEDNDRTVNVTLSNATGADLGLSAALLTIVDDEALVCDPDGDTLCLNADDRFKAEITWTDFEGNTGDGGTIDFGAQDSGIFYFFSEDNAEMLLKVLNACVEELGNRYWVFFAATTNVEFTLTVTDTETGVVREYFNPLGNAAPPVLDIEGFATCP